MRNIPRYPRQIAKSEILDVPNFHELLCRFLYDQRNPDASLTENDVPISECPKYSGKIDVFSSASAYYYAPSDMCGSQGMIRQVIHSTPCWRQGPPRYDCILVAQDPSLPGLAGMYIAQVILFFSFDYRDYHHFPCALVKWFTILENPCPVTGMWMVQPEYDDDHERVISVIHVESILRGVHLIPVYGQEFTNTELHFSHSLDVFRTFYISKYSDYHAFQLLHTCPR